MHIALTFLFVSSSNTIQIVLATAHPAKFAAAVAVSLADSPSFDFDRDVLPEEFIGLLDRERRVIDVEGIEIELTKAVIEREVAKSRAAAAAGVKSV